MVAGTSGEDRAGKSDEKVLEEKDSGEDTQNEAEKKMERRSRGNIGEAPFYERFSN